MIWREKTRRDIPGSIWLPDTGYGELAGETEVISASVSNVPCRAMAQNCWSFIVFVIAGCRGMPRSERWR